MLPFTNASWHYRRDPAGNLLSLQHDPGPGQPLAVTTRAHNALNQITGVTGGGATLVRGTLDEPGHVAVGRAGIGDRPARMLDETTFEAELDLPEGTSDITVAAQDPSGNKRTNNYQVQVAATDACSFAYDDDGNLLSDGKQGDCLIVSQAYSGTRHHTPFIDT